MIYAKIALFGATTHVICANCAEKKYQLFRLKSHCPLTPLIYYTHLEKARVCLSVSRYNVWREKSEMGTLQITAAKEPFLLIA